MNKENTYTQLLPQIAAMIEGETCETSVLANVAAALHQAFDQFFWTGFYMLHPDGMLRLGPVSRSTCMLCHRHRQGCVWQSL